ncbi:hypothetical protein M3Y95_01281400 [Aphelenchoides besseyi]|nr:hypothetical protein M3Y95_01281400 [Aphelenchoides besseyi]
MYDRYIPKTEPIKKASQTDQSVDLRFQSRIPKIVQRVVKSESSIPVPICAAKVVDSLTLLSAKKLKKDKEDKKVVVEHTSPSICWINSKESCQCKEYVRLDDIISDWKSKRDTCSANESNATDPLTSWAVKSETDTLTSELLSTDQENDAVSKTEVLPQNPTDISVTNYVRLLEAVVDDYVRLNKKLTSQQSIV